MGIISGIIGYFKKNFRNENLKHNILEAKYNARIHVSVARAYLHPGLPGPVPWLI